MMPAWCDGETRHADRVQPRRNRHRLLPVRAPPVVREVELFDQQPVRHHLIVTRRRDDELAGGLVVGMIDHRQPVPRAVRPVLAEHAALAVDVVAEPQALGGDALVADREREFLSGPRCGGSTSRRRSLACVNTMRVGGGPGRVGGAAAPHRGHRHAFTGGNRDEIELHVADLVEQELHRHGGFTGDLVGAVAERQPEDVVNGIDAGLPRIRVGSDAWKRRPPPSGRPMRFDAWPIISSAMRTGVGFSQPH